ncbi:MAG: hypothetical protein SGARI_005617, partial [Bacillariaceae sp.]
ATQQANDSKSLDHHVNNATATNHSRASSKRKRNPADDLICPITLELPLDPVMAADGRVYEREAIMQHFDSSINQAKSPFTNKVLGTKQVIDATQHRNTIETLIENNMIVGELAKTWKEKKQENAALLAKAEAGDVEAIEKVAFNYFWKVNGFRPNSSECYKWCKRLQELDNPKGIAYIGVIHLYGLPASIPIDTKRGLDYIQEAANRFSNLGAYEFAKVLSIEHAKYGVEENEGDACMFLEEAIREPCQHDHIPTHDHIPPHYKQKARVLLENLARKIGWWDIVSEAAGDSDDGDGPGLFVQRVHTQAGN